MSGGERILYGQRVDGVVRVTDVPAEGRGRAYLVERELTQDGHAALLALVADYILCRPLEYADRGVMWLVLRGSFGCCVGIFDRRLG